jgi:hypothetical protein
LVLTLRDKCRVRVLEDRVLRKMFGPKREAVMSGCRELHDEEIDTLYFSSNVIRVIKSRVMGW